MASHAPQHRRWPHRFKAALRERFFLRFHMTLILVAVALSGLGISKLLAAVGLTHIQLRYPLAVVCAYGVFFVLVRIWLWYVSLAHEERADHDGGLVDHVDDVADLADVAGAVGHEVGGSVRGGGSSGQGGGWSLGDAADGDGAGVVLILLVVVLCVVFGSGLYLIWEAPALLGEAALQMMLAASLRRAARRMDAPHWAGSVLGASWLPFVIVAIVVWIFAAVAGSVCPDETKLGEILICVGA